MSEQNEGAVIWITGLSGAGKTTIGRIVHDHLSREGWRTIMLDGDELREVFAQGDKFDRESRLQLALSYGRLCLMLARQGFTVVCATISMRKEVYAWNRANLPGYTEVFLDVPKEIRSARDPKNYYARAAQGGLSEFSGHDLDVDLPVSPHIHVCPTDAEESAETARYILEKILALQPRQLHQN